MKSSTFQGFFNNLVNPKGLQIVLNMVDETLLPVLSFTLGNDTWLMIFSGAPCSTFWICKEFEQIKQQLVWLLLTSFAKDQIQKMLQISCGSSVWKTLAKRQDVLYNSCSTTTKDFCSTFLVRILFQEKNEPTIISSSCFGTKKSIFIWCHSFVFFEQIKEFCRKSVNFQSDFFSKLLWKKSSIKSR